MIVPKDLCLGNVSKDFSVSNMKKSGFNGHVCISSIDYDAIDYDNTLDILKYLLKKMT